MRHDNISYRCLRSRPVGDTHYGLLLTTYRMLISMTTPKVTKSNGSFVFNLSKVD